MRTTLTLDPDVAERVRGEMRRSGRGMKAVINEAIRHGLGLIPKRKAASRFVVKPHDFQFRPGVDLDRINQLVDELEVAETRRKREP